ncbi:transmembrane protein 231 isoform X2 [Cimex lectularius]|uniref:Transmembrane protein 231 n=1 Tax=Cimex lectularius TaxID=79782 RepID=A0A8I6SNV1_CIMLE|nr:transmembrane protein 231 isoform X2 [Cimex lectularius]
MRTHGFWIKSDVYREQPDVHFMYEYLIMLETEKADCPVICTTFNALSQATESFNKCSVIKVREVDNNKDGKNEKLFFEAEALLEPVENVFSVTLILVLNYKLYSYSWLEMQTLAWIEATSGVGGSQLSINGDLRLHQRQLLSNKGKDFRYNTSIVSANYTHEFDLFDFLSSYAERNITTKVDNVYTVWKRGRDPEMPFQISLILTYPEDNVQYRPGTWHVLKLAWVQYFALLYISVLIGRRVKHFILDYRLVHNIRYEPWKKAL